MERAQSCSFHGRDMDEYVFRSIIGLNKSIALLSVEPLYCSARHCRFLETQNAAIQHWVAGQSQHGTESKSGALRAGNADEPRKIDSSDIPCLRPLYKVSIRSRGRTGAAGTANARLNGSCRGWPTFCAIFTPCIGELASARSQGRRMKADRRLVAWQEMISLLE